MSNIGIEINDYYGLLNLHKALLEARFHQNPDNQNVAGSPVIAKLHNEVIDKLEQFDEQKEKGDVKRDGRIGENTGTWSEWRMLKNQTFYRDRAVANAVNVTYLKSNWKSMSDEEKTEIARNYLSPFKATEEELESFVEEVGNGIF